MRLVGQDSKRNSCSVTCLYFAADKLPFTQPILVLNGEGQGPVNTLCIPSNIAPSYAPPGTARISASVLGDPHHTDQTRENEVRAQLSEWFGPDAKRWRHLRIYHIQHTLPD